MSQSILAAIIFLLTYAIIVTERVHRTTAALLGGMLMLWFGGLDQKAALQAIDLNVILLLVGMMVIAYYLGETGVFQWMAIHAVRIGRGHPVTVMAIIAVMTAIASALLDNVTVVVLIAPVTLYVASTLGVSPIPFLITEVMASNIGGAATLIGDPPNILIGSRANMDFVDFLVNMAPPALMALAAYIGVMYIQFRNALDVSPERRVAVMRLETRGLITRPDLLLKSGIVLLLVVIGFLLHGMLHIAPATVALSGATLLLLWTRTDPYEVLQHVEWATLMFFVGLFIAVEGIVQAGVIEWVAEEVLLLTRENLTITTLFILWGSAVASGIVDNIPYTATMLPIVESLGRVMPVEPLWWALALGADFGGNLTLVGASANVVVASLAERSGHRMTFKMFLRYGVLTVLVSLTVATAWLWWQFL